MKSKPSFPRRAIAGARAFAQAIRNDGHVGRVLVPRFRYDFEHVRAGQIIDRWHAQNVVTTEGGLNLLDVYFDAATQITAWYLGLISSASYASTPDITDVAANLDDDANGWAECSATYAPNYDTPAGTARGTVTFGEPTGTDPVSLASSAVNFIFSGGGTVKGSFLASNGTRLNNTGTLYSAALFSGGDRAVVDNDELNVTVTASFDLSPA